MLMLISSVAAALALEPLTTSTSSQEQEILLIERSWNTAVAARDAATIAGILSADFRFVAPDGSIHDRAAMLRMAADREYVIEPFATRDTRVIVDGTLAIVTGCFRQTGAFRGQPFASTYRYVDAYRREATGWRSFYAQAAQVRSADPSCG